MKKGNGVSSPIKKNNLSHETFISVPFCFKYAQYNGMVLSMVNGCDLITSKIRRLERILRDIFKRINFIVT